MHPGHWIHFNAALTVHNFHSTREHSLPGIAAYNGAGKFKHNNLSPPTGSPGSRAAMWINCLAEGQKCRGDGEIRTRAFSVRVERILQYTTTPPHTLHSYFPHRMCDGFNHASIRDFNLRLLDQNAHKTLKTNRGCLLSNTQLSV